MRNFTIVAAILVSTMALAAGSERDFSGKWVLSTAATKRGDLREQPEPFLTIEQSPSTLRCATEAGGKPVQWSYALNGDETKYRVGAETRSSAVKWEGAALLVNTLVSGPRNYVIMDRWRLSVDRVSLIVTRQVMQGQNQTEGTLVYRRDGVEQVTPPSLSESSTVISPGPAVVTAPATPSLRERPEPAPAAPQAFTVRAGTRILLHLLNTIDTKHSHEGDRVYLQTSVPVAVDGRIVIPQGSSVVATVSNAKQPGKVKGKGELFLRFESVTLPNGVTRDFRSRLSAADGARGEVDRKEGKVTSPGNKAGDARTVATGAGVGAAVGGIAGAVGGNARLGTGIGAAAGAAAGLGRILTKRGPDASLPRGTGVEMLLDRDLQFTAEELLF